jgi:hypothetical protein
VSILDRFARSPHLDEAALAELWSTAATEGRAATHPHLTVCAHCRARHAGLRAWLDALRADELAAADEAFPPERLAAQQAQIARRLEAMERPARVIAFPKFSRAQGSVPGTQRWIAAAAAAGLVVGLAAGQLVDLRRNLRPSSARIAPDVRLSQAERPGRGSGVQPVSAAVSDETFLYEDTTRPAVRISELRGLDAITPRARDLDPPR